MRELLFKTLTLICLFLSTTSEATLVSGRITDLETDEPLIGATIQIHGSDIGTITDFDGNYTIRIEPGNYTLIYKYIGHKDCKKEISIRENNIVINLPMESEAELLDEVKVVAKRNLENEQVLTLERRASNIAIENLGSHEMAIKGIGNAQEGVKKITGISVETSGNLVVRGLGDRYSTTTLNGLPIASPNPDNKLIPLDLFPSSTIQNITVSKVYDAASFADYSGAHIDICTKNNIVNDLFSVSFNIGGKANTLGMPRYQMDNDMNLFKNSSIDPKAFSLSLTQFDNYVKTNNVFSTSYQVKQTTSLPDMGGNICFGKNFRIGSSSLTLLAALNAGYEQQNMPNSYFKTLEATGNILDQFEYDSYSSKQNITALGHLGYSFCESHQISYTFFYSRSFTNTYQLRSGVDSEGHNLIGSNNITHIYALQNHQINGQHGIGSHWKILWKGSYGITSNEEPDRRQVMFIKDDNEQLHLFKLNRQETMRYFGSLDETEWNGSLSAQWSWNENSLLKFGCEVKDKKRDYFGTRFYYNINKLSPEIDDVFSTNDYLNFDNIAAGNIEVERKMQPKDSYRAGTRIISGYILSDIYIVKDLLLNIGLRYENNNQWVEYATDGGERYARRRDMNTHDFFPALNLKYTFFDEHCLRFAASRTVTRPSFIEMAPFLYQESYSSAQLRGNEELQNGYNYNIDLRYEFIRQNGDMVSVTGYFKYLDKPIERIQTLQGGATLHSFKNADNGIAGGIEVEFSKRFFKDLKIGANASYMHTNVKLPADGAYTNKERALQGASPILVNADITYSPEFKNKHRIDMALLYNLQGTRIHAVGISQLGDVKQQPLHTLNFNCTYTFRKQLSIKIQVNNLLNSKITFKQEVPSTNQQIDVEQYRKGTNFEIGISYKL